MGTDRLKGTAAVMPQREGDSLNLSLITSPQLMYLNILPQVTLLFHLILPLNYTLLSLPLFSLNPSLFSLFGEETSPNTLKQTKMSVNSV